MGSHISVDFSDRNYVFFQKYRRIASDANLGCFCGWFLGLSELEKIRDQRARKEKSRSAEAAQRALWTTLWKQDVVSSEHWCIGKESRLSCRRASQKRRAKKKCQVRTIKSFSLVRR